MSSTRPRPTRASLLRWLVPVVVIAAIVAGCTSAASAQPTVSGAWLRPSTGLAVPVAAYLTITNPGTVADTLIDASSPAAQSVEIHDTGTTNGMTGMTMMDRVSVGPGSTVTFAPGGMHLMLIGLTKPLAVGDTVELDLTFEHAGRIVVQAAVREN
jgi:copper(I)-binding protein